MTAPSDTPAPSASTEAVRLIACLDEWRSYLNVALEQLQFHAVRELERMSAPDAAVALRLQLRGELLDEHVDNQSLHLQHDLAMILSRLGTAITDDLDADRGER